MCGILGSITEKESTINDGFEQNLQLLRHRGPDNQTVYREILGSSNLALGHARLSILDLSNDANQPFFSSCARYSIIYNGEIYNYQELKDSYLPDLVMQTTSDTEVLLNLYISYGETMLNMLDGMFAFAILDRVSKKVFCARDQLGIKPLYFFNYHEGFIFSSEIKPILSLSKVSPSLDEYALYEFMINSFCYEPRTGFKGISKLGAGEYMTVDIENRRIENIQRYWIPSQHEHNNNYCIKQAPIPLEDIDNEINSSINQQMRSDVPVGLFFSGGVDSTVILTQLHGKVGSITIKNDSNDVDESGQTDDYFYANKIAKYFDAPLKEVVLDKEKSGEAFLHNIKTLAAFNEELISDYTFIASMSLAKASKDMGYTVMLSGMGADEVFGGYPRYQLLIGRWLYCPLCSVISFTFGKNKRFNKKIDRLKRYCESRNFVDQYTSILGYFSKKEVQDNYIFYKEDFDIKYRNKLDSLVSFISSPLKKAMYLDIFGFLAHNFTVGDKSSMQASIELRVPLATKRLYEKVFLLSGNKIISISKSKKLLRSFLNGKVSKGDIDRRKAGFHPPIDNLIRSLGKEAIRNEMLSAGLEKLLSIKLIDNTLQEHFDHKKNHTNKIFQLLFLAYWYEFYIGGVKSLD